ncbi:MAG: sn-glycerol-3-phosphate ABC transporter substrate-binding protein UgpB [Geminicoccaceae bacterium]
MPLKHIFLTATAIAAPLLTAAAAPAPAPTEIELWHAMSGANTQRIEALVQEFNKEHTDYKVVPSFKGTYAEALTAGIAAFRAGNPPAILQVQEVATASFMAAKGAVRPIAKVMHDADMPFDPSSYVAAVTGYYTAPSGEMLSFPFNSSTPVLYYNKDLMRQAGLDPSQPPRTWEEMGEATQKLRAAGVPCGYTTTWMSWIELENLAARHGQDFATLNNGFDGLGTSLRITEPLFVKQIATLADWQKTKQFDYGGRTNKATPKFTSGECALFTESSAGYANVKAGAKFDWGIAPLPYWASEVKKPSNTIIGGASLWVMEKKPAAVYKGVAAFLDYLSRPDVQGKWSMQTGYLPITPAAYDYVKEQSFYEQNPGTEVGILELNPDEPAKIKGIRLGNFLQIRDIIDEELEKVWAGQATAADALKAAATRSDAELRKFEAASQ